MPGQVDLATEITPFDAKAPKYAALLNNLQGNILTSHGRHFSVHYFFKFGADAAASKAAVKALRGEGFIHSAAEQAAQSARFAQPGAAQEVFGTLLLSASGLKALGLNLPAGFGDSLKPPGLPINVSFADPMRAAAAELGDTPAAWQAEYQDQIDGLLIVAYGNSDADNDQEILDQCYTRAAAARRILETAGITIEAMETGHAHLRGGQPREHFGFVDGISQPLFRSADMPAQIDQFDPGAGLVNLVVADPFTGADDAFASFFVFRKLEQNVQGWRQAVLATSNQLGAAPELVGAMAVGRFQNGDPVLAASEPTGANPQATIPNNFNYSGDVDGLRCPYHAHIRKSNPRGDTERNFAPGVDAVNAVERSRRIARRGVSYGNRAPDLSDAPATGVGLLFMCYQANIPDQFAFIQKNWVDNNGFAKANVGQDAVIGQGNRVNQIWPNPWNGPATKALPDFGQFVTNKGGEFFIALSIPAIESM